MGLLGDVSFVFYDLIFCISCIIYQFSFFEKNSCLSCCGFQFHLNYKSKNIMLISPKVLSPAWVWIAHIVLLFMFLDRCLWWFVRCSWMVRTGWGDGVVYSRVDLWCCGAVCSFVGARLICANDNFKSLYGERPGLTTKHLVSSCILSLPFTFPNYH